jgi:hypothetical protein
MEETIVRPINEEQTARRDKLLEEYRDLTKIAEEALTGIPIRGRPNWEKFYEVQERIASVVQRIRDINEGAA